MINIREDKLMRKKLIAAASAAAICLAPAAFAQEDIKVFLDGSEIGFDVAPVIEDGRTLVPVRAIFEALGAVVEWDQETQTVISAMGTKICALQINNENMYVSGEEVKLDVPAKIIGDRTLVPLRAISEAYGCEVDWDDNTRTVTVSSAASAD